MTLIDNSLKKCVPKMFFLHVLSGLLNNFMKRFFLLTEITGEILQTTSHWYQMDPRVFLYNTALSAQLPCLAGLSL